AVVAALVPAVVAALDPELSDPHAASAMAVTATGPTRSRQFDRCFIRVGPPHWSRPGASPRRDRDGTTTYGHVNKCVTSVSYRAAFLLVSAHQVEQTWLLDMKVYSTSDRTGSGRCDHPGRLHHLDVSLARPVRTRCGGS